MRREGVHSTTREIIISCHSSGVVRGRMGMGSAGLVMDLFFQPRSGANCAVPRTRSMLVAVCQHSRVWGIRPGEEGSRMTLGSCSGRFGLPTVMETTLGYFGMPEHRLM
jgi:hypothetical protein